MSRKLRHAGRRAVAALGALALTLLMGVSVPASPQSGAVFNTSQMIVSSTDTATQFELPASSATAGVRSAALSWNASTGATGYTIYQCERSGSDCIDVVTVAEVSAGTLSYTVNGLKPGINYIFTVIADLNDKSRTNSTFPVTTLMPASAAVTAVAASSSQINTSWTAVADATTYTLERSTSAIFTAPTVVYTGPSRSMADAGLAADAMYYYRVTATGADFTVQSPIVHAQTLSGPSLAAAIVGANANGLTQIDVTWSTVPGATSYTLQRATTAAFTAPTNVYTGTVVAKSDTGLAQGTTYYYRVIATDGTITSTSSVVSATTAAQIGTTTLAASAVGLSQIDLSWTAVTGVNGYTLQRSASAAFTSPTAVYSGTATSYTNTGLTSGTTYYYRVIAADNFSQSTSGTASATTASPIAASTVTPTSAGLTQIDVTWTGVAGATGYELQRSTSASFTSPTTVYTGTGLTFSNASLSSATTYYYRVVATGVYNTTTSGIASATTEAPLTASTLAASPVGATQVDASWSAVPGAASYELQRSASASFTSPTTIYTGTDTAFSDTTVSASTTYYYRVVASSTYSTSTSNTATVTTSAPLAASTITATAAGPSQINTSWTSVPTATTYQVQRSTSASFTSPTTVYTGTATSYNNTGLSSATPYWYRVVASNGTGTSISNIATATTATPLGASTVSAAPYNVGNNRIDYTAVSGATSYTIQQSLSASMASPTTLYTGTYHPGGFIYDGPVTAGTTYYYRVTVTDGTQTAVSNIASATAATPIAASTITATAAGLSQVNTSWTPVSGAISYTLQRSASASMTSPTVLYSGGTATSFTDTGLTASTTYYYRIQTVGPYNTTNSTVVSTTTTSPIATSTVTATTGGPATINTSWTTVAGSTGYTLQRATNAAFTTGVTSVYTGTATTFADTGLTASTTYYYRVVAAGPYNSTTSGNASAATAAALGTSTVNAVTAGTTQINNTWTTVTGATSYTLQRATNAAFTAGVTSVYTGTATSYSNTGLASNTTYYYRVTATGTYESTTSAVDSDTTAAVLAASTLTATPSGSSLVNTSWTAVSGATSYTLQRSLSSSMTSPTTMYTGASTSFADSGVTGGTTYYYRVTANSTYSTSNSSVVSATPVAPFGTPSLVAGLNGPTAINVSWSAPSGATSYTLQRSASASMTSPTTVYTGTATSYNNTGLTANTTYYYRVTATNGSVTTTSNVDYDTTPATLTSSTLSASLSGGTGASLSWTAVSGATSYQLQRSTSSTFSSVTNLYSGASTSYADSGLSAGTTYYYRVVASNSWYTSTSNTGTVTTSSPLAASTLSLAVKGTSSLQLTWTAVSGATSYQLMRSTSASMSGATTVYSGSSTTFTNTGLAAGSRYYYQITATNGSSSSQSNIVVGATALRQWATGINPWRIGIDQSTGNISLTNRDSKNIQIITNSGGASRTIATTGNVFGVTVDNTGITYAVQNPTGSTSVLVVNKGGTTIARTITLPGTAGSQLTTRDSDGMLFVGNKTTTVNYVSVIARGGSAPTRNVTISGTPLDMVVNAAGDRLIVSMQDAKVAVINLSTWAVTYPSGGPTEAYKPSVDPQTGYIWIPDFVGTRVWALNSTGTSYVTSINIPTSSTLASAEVNELTGDLYVADNAQQLWVIPRGATSPDRVISQPMIMMDTYDANGYLYGFDRTGQILYENPAP